MVAGGGARHERNHRIITQITTTAPAGAAELNRGLPLIGRSPLPPLRGGGGLGDGVFRWFRWRSTTGYYLPSLRDERQAQD